MEKVAILVFILITVPIIFLIVLKGEKTEKIDYRIYECEQTSLLKGWRTSFNYDTQTKNLTLFIQTNCCGIDLKVEKENEIIEL